MTPAKPLPLAEGQRSVTPHLVVRGATRAIEFYKQALGAEELVRLPEEILKNAAGAFEG